MSLNILYITRKDWLQNWGGDSVQMLYIKKYLEKIGNLKISIETNPLILKKCIKDFDIVHIFNIQRLSEAIYYVHLAKDNEKKLIISPIFGDLSRATSKSIFKILNENFIYLAKDLARVMHGVSYSKTFLFHLRKYLFATFKTKIKNILSLSEVVIPNSIAEANYLKRVFQISDEKIKVIKNGVDPDILKIEYTESNFKRDFGIPFNDNFVLSVSRFVFRKNVLNLLRAVEGTNIKLVLIAQKSPINEFYYQKCNEIIKASKNIYHINSKLNIDKLVGAYKACHTHALVSYLETPGLVNLEASLFGVNLVLGDCEPVKEYFGNYALYCDPDDIEDIRAKIIMSLDREKNYSLSEYVRENLSWEKIALKYYEVYKKIIQ